MGHTLAARCRRAALWEKRCARSGCHSCDGGKVLVTYAGLGTLELAFQPGTLGRLRVTASLALLFVVASLAITARRACRC